MRQKCLVLDIETAPLVASVWGLKDQNISLAQIHADINIIAWSAKWLGDPPSKIMYRDLRHTQNKRDDKALIKPLWKLLDQADIVITQNGQNFDCPLLNARFIFHKMPPPSPYKHLDTYKIARSVAKFTSNKLEYLTDKLNVKYKKLSHKKFPGWSLWHECMRGNIKAWDEMKRYNIHDVFSTEELYLNLRAWAPNNAPMIYPAGDPLDHCGTCGSTKVHARGYNFSRVSRFKKIQCQSCHKWTVGNREAL
jgi:DNA polymerase elongation subunit (family B)